MPSVLFCSPVILVNFSLMLPVMSFSNLVMFFSVFTSLHCLTLEYLLFETPSFFGFIGITLSPFLYVSEKSFSYLFHPTFKSRCSPVGWRGKQREIEIETLPRIQVPAWSKRNWCSPRKGRIT